MTHERGSKPDRAETGTGSVHESPGADRHSPETVAEQTPISAGLADETPGEALARVFHDTYERLAPSFGYETREDTKQFDAATPNGRLMIAVCSEIITALALRAPASGDASGEGVADNIRRECPVPFCITYGCQGAIAPHCAALSCTPPAVPSEASGEGLACCPFCGGSNLDEVYEDRRDFFLVGCMDCWTQGPSRKTFDEAKVAWNVRAALSRRSDPPEPVAGDAELEAINARIDAGDEQLAQALSEYEDLTVAGDAPAVPSGEGLRQALKAARDYVERKSWDAFDDREDKLLAVIDAVLNGGSSHE